MDKRIVGVDVSKDWLDGALAGETGVTRIANTPMAIAAWLDRIAPDVVACEPTGGWERTLRKEAHRLRFSSTWRPAFAIAGAAG